MSKPYTIKDPLHRDSALSIVIEKQGNNYYFSTVAVRPSTVVIYNVPTVDADWTPIITGLTNVLAWKLTERDGNAFHYCFDGVGTTYMTSYGDLQRDTALTAIYAKRTGATDINLQLEVWTI